MAGRLLILGCLAVVLSGCVSTGSGRGYSSNHYSRQDGYSSGYAYRQSYYGTPYRRDYDDDRRSEREKKCGCRIKPFKALKRAFGL
jgi:hypothetical protein